MPAIGGNQCGLLTIDVDDITDADVAGWVVAVTNEAMPNTIAPPAMTVLGPAANRAGVRRLDA